MSEPIVYISHNRVKPGKLEALRELYREASQELEATKPDTLVYLGYVSDDGSEVTFLHVFPDAEAMDRHMQGVPGRAKAAYEFMQPVRLEIYGQPSPATLEAIRRIAGAGVALSLSRQYLGGYIRPNAP
jgi:quinol monooxygenase YgiN